MKLRLIRTLNETVRTFQYALLTGGYEVMDDDDKVHAQADVQEGAIKVFACSPKFNEHTRNLVMGGMLKTIIEDADAMNSNLSITLTSNEMLPKRFFERFGFRQNYGETLVRIAGSIMPPSVI